ncbi:MAG: polysaccharide deacetylase family protein [Pseudomonadota bacterium]|nr:MAG: polysaccharide deacetylase family protein [Pseudomonadota bacterium]
MRRASLLAVFLLCPGLILAGGEIPVLTYHDIVERPNGDAFAVTREQFRAQLAYLKREGYQAVSLAQVEGAARGESSLPDKPVVLTFDDGLRSFLTEAVPLLAEHKFASVLSVVTGWLDGEDTPRAYRGRVMSWEELRTAAALPRVEVISHSHALHRGLVGNPQGNELAAGVVRIFDPDLGYETDQEFRRRLRTDLEKSRERLVAELKRPPMAIAWPYGAYNQIGVEEAARAGMRLHLTLDERPATLADLPRINRMTFHRYRRLSDLDDMLRFRKYRTEQRRFIEVELDAWARKDDAEQEQMLSALVRRLDLLGVNTVIIDPLSHDRQRAWFHTRAMPMAGEVLSRLLHQITTRNRIFHLYLRLPTEIIGQDTLRVYSDLTRLNRFNGVIFDGAPDKNTVALVDALRYQQPALLVGWIGDAPRNLTLDFRLVELDTHLDGETLAARAHKELASARMPVHFMLSPVRRESEAALLAAMRVLRAAGVAHYGYGGDDFFSNVPDVMRVVTELRAHTIIDKSDATQGMRRGGS